MDQWLTLLLKRCLFLSIMIVSLVTASCSGVVRHPVIFFPGYGGSNIAFDIKFSPQYALPGCPTSGAARFVTNRTGDFLEGGALGPLCFSSIATNVYSRSKEPLRRRFSPQRGVKVSIPFYGSPKCAALYTETIPSLTPLYQALLREGYKPGYDLFYACYDYRMAPNTDVTSGHRFVREARRLIMKAHKLTGLPVYLMGHSNGPPYAKYLLEIATAKWKKKHIAGLIGLAGSWAGQSGIYSSLLDEVAGPILETWSSSYSGSANPKIYGDSIVFVADALTGVNYTAANAPRFFRDAGLSLAGELWPLFVGTYTPLKLPNVDTYVFYGIDVPTDVGVVQKGLQRGAETVGTTTYPGDGDQEYPDNDAALLWKNMKCHRFEVKKLPGVDHISLVSNDVVLKSVMQIVKTPPKKCPLNTYGPALV